ncbi:TIGR00730 family Rossman fold protein [Candidatus Dependentiae bacterium]|nr:MAG: TIGR00730 family Rossman fold protein [Candidatus Dependentiae bacterium]
MMFFKRLRLLFLGYWSFLRVNWQILYGLWRLTGIPRPMVTIFGGSRMPQEDPYAKQAHQLGHKLVTHDISVLTGGGPGIMEAASCGAVAVGKKSMSLGIGVTELGEGRNPCVQEYIALDYFFARKWLLTRYSIAFVVFPGGFGTLDELGEILTLIHTNKLPRVPIVLIGNEYWYLFMQWLNNEALKHGLITYDDLTLFTVTDDIDYAFTIIHEACKKTKGNKKV